MFKKTLSSHFSQRMPSFYFWRTIYKPRARESSIVMTQNVNTVSPDIKMDIILLIFLLTFRMDLVRRICLNIKTSYPW